MNMIMEHIKVRFPPGSELYKCLKETIARAKAEKCVIEFVFNGVFFEISGESGVSLALEQYHAALRKKVVTGVEQPAARQGES